jgi:beta-lactamase class A
MEWTDGMLYPVLHRLERLGHVEARWEVAESGRRRKYYRITSRGRKNQEAHGRVALMEEAAPPIGPGTGADPSAPVAGRRDGPWNCGRALPMTPELESSIRASAGSAGASAVAVAYRDLATGAGGSLEADRWFHAASTIKLAVLVALYAVIDREGLDGQARVHVRNQFTSLADGRYYRIDPDRDGNTRVHEHVGRTMRVEDLARHMITTSSNLATNVLVELLGAEVIRGVLDLLGVTGIEFRRGVEDERAWQAGVNNRVTARGLLDLLTLVAEERAISPGACQAMLGILHDQRFVSGIPAGLPDEARVANKTGEISTVAHDAGIVYLPDRDPYIVVVLTEWGSDGDPGPRRALIADISRQVLGSIAEEVHG